MSWDVHPSKVGDCGIIIEKMTANFFYIVSDYFLILLL